MSTFLLRDAEATRAAGRALGRALLTLSFDQPIVITLQGELGAGKTTLVSGLLNALGHEGVVRSPTYTLIEPYEFDRLQVYHLDLYRLTDPLQLEDIGMRDLLQPGAVLLVEWPERAGSMLARPDLRVLLQYPSDGLDHRQLTLQPLNQSLEQLVHSLTISADSQ